MHSGRPGCTLPHLSAEARTTHTGPPAPTHRGRAGPPAQLARGRPCGPSPMPARRPTTARGRPPDRTRAGPRDDVGARRRPRPRDHMWRCRAPSWGELAPTHGRPSGHVRQWCAPTGRPPWARCRGASWRHPAHRANGPPADIGTRERLALERRCRPPTERHPVRPLCVSGMATCEAAVRHWNGEPCENPVQRQPFSGGESRFENRKSRGKFFYKSSRAGRVN